jgi:hypothetical protein
MGYGKSGRSTYQQPRSFKHPAVKHKPTHGGAKFAARVQQKPQEWLPPDVKSEADRQVYEVFKLRAPSFEKGERDWGSSGFLNEPAGIMLQKSHWEKVKKLLRKKPPKNKNDAVKLLKETMQLPEQKFIFYYEASLRGPLNEKGMLTYMSLVKELFPQIYKMLYGKMDQKQLAGHIHQMAKQMGHS